MVFKNGGHTCLECFLLPCIVYGGLNQMFQMLIISIDNVGKLS